MSTQVPATFCAGAWILGGYTAVMLSTMFLLDKDHSEGSAGNCAVHATARHHLYMENIE